MSAHIINFSQPKVLCMNTWKDTTLLPFDCIYQNKLTIANCFIQICPHKFCPWWWGLVTRGNAPFVSTKVPRKGTCLSMLRQSILSLLVMNAQHAESTAKHTLPLEAITRDNTDSDSINYFIKWDWLLCFLILQTCRLRPYPWCPRWTMCGTALSVHIRV